MTRYSRFFAVALWVTMFVVYALAVSPNQRPQLGSDKLDHMAAFLTLAVLGGLAMPRLSLLWIAAGLAAFGGLIEFTQMIPALHRDASLYDWLADVGAVAIGLLAVAPFRRETQAAD